MSDVISPRQFGVVGDGSDEGESLQAFFDLVDQRGFRAIDFGDLEVCTSRALTLGGVDRNTLKLASGYLSIKALGDLGPDSTVLEVAGHDQIVWQAHTYIDGGGQVNRHDTWGADRGLEFVDCRHAVASNIHTYKCREWGVRIRNQTGDGRINSFWDLGNVEAVDCGHAAYGAGEVMTTLTADPVRHGGQFANRQTCTLSLASVPSFLRQGGFVVLDDPGGHYPYFVEAVSGNDVTVFPWVHSSVGAGDTVRFMTGGGVYVGGNNSNVGRVDRLRGVRCALGVQIDASYNTDLGRPYFQACNAPLVIGKDPKAAVHGVSLDGFGAETGGTLDLFGPIMLTRALVAGNVWGYPLQPWLGLHQPRGANDAFSQVTSAANGIEQEVGRDGVLQQQWNAPGGYLSGNAAKNVISNGPKSKATLVAASPGVTLKWDAGADDRGYGDVCLTWAATDKDESSALTVALDSDDVAAGWTIDQEGGAFDRSVLTVPNQGAMVDVRLCADVQSKRWVAGVFCSQIIQEVEAS